jgi:hypothetical protein
MTIPFFLLCCVLLGCEMEKSSQPAKTQAETLAAPATEKGHINVEDLQVSDLWMRKSEVAPITGDLRPLYRVHGRIQNLAYYTATRIKLQVEVWVPYAPPRNMRTAPKAEMVDSAVLEIESEILPGTTQSFEQQIHIAPPSGHWDWRCQAIEVDAANP